MTRVNDASEMWWGLVTGPREVVKDTLRYLGDGYSVLLVTGGGIPWRDEFRLRISNGLASMRSTTGMELRDVNVDDMCEDDEPIDYMLENFALKKDAIDFRVGIDSQAYLRERNVISESVLHVYGSDFGKMRRWLSFCSRWPRGSKESGLFILEVNEGEYDTSIGSLKKISYIERTSDYCVQLFNGLCLERGISAGLSSERRKYLASAITHLCGGDLELSERLANRLTRPPFDPAVAYVEIGGGASEDEICRCIWEAQVETVFSIVQRRHMNIIDALRPQLESILANRVIKQYGERVVDSDDIELGTLVYLMADRYEKGPVLSVPSQQIRNEIHLLRECRNAIAHRQCCTEEQIRQLLG